MKGHLIVLGAALVVLCTLARGAAPSTGSAALDLKPALRAYSHQIEDDLGELMQRRHHPAGNPSPVLELQIDLRVLADTLLTRAASGNSGDDVAACAYLRARELCAVADDLQKRSGTAALTPEALDAAKQLHQMTFAVPASGTQAQLDDLGSQVGSLMLRILGPLPAGMNGLPPMRPGSADGSESGEPRIRSLQELTEVARRAAIGSELKHELLALADQASSAAAEPAHAEEYAALYRALGQCIELTEAIQRGGLVEPQERDATELQLTRAILLFLDVRTRAIGGSRIDDLLNYRRMFQSVQAMHLSQDLWDRLIPAFTWIRQHPGDDGPAVMNTIETWVRLCAQHDRREHPNLSAAQKHSVEGLEKRFARQRATFLADATNLVASDNPVDDLEFDVSQLNGTFDAIDLIEQVPAQLNALAAYKVRPTSGLDRRVAGACAALGSDAEGPGTETATRFLADVRLMARLAGQLANPAMPPEIDEAYAGGHLADFNRRRGDLLNGLVAEASVRELSQPQRAQLDAALDLGDALIEAVKIERISQQTALTRWVDWDASAQSIAMLLGTYRDATASAFHTFGQRDGQPFKLWKGEFERTRALRDLLNAVASEADACARLPDGWPGEVAKLLTPMNGQPFGLERFASVAMSHLGEADSPSPVEVIAAMTQQGSASSGLTQRVSTRR